MQVSSDNVGDDGDGNSNGLRNGHFYEKNGRYGGKTGASQDESQGKKNTTTFKVASHLGFWSLEASEYADLWLNDVISCSYLNGC